MQEKKKRSIEDIPDLKSDKFVEPITTRITLEQFNYLEALKRKKEKGPADLIRMLLDDFMEENPL